MAYYPVIVDGRWTLTAVAQPAINGVFTRTITIYSVNRDVNDDIAEAGTDDPKTKRIVASVSWLERGNNEAVSLQAYLTNFLNNFLYAVPFIIAYQFLFLWNPKIPWLVLSLLLFCFFHHSHTSFARSCFFLRVVYGYKHFSF